MIFYLKNTKPIVNEKKFIDNDNSNSDLKLRRRANTNNNHSISTTKISNRTKFVIVAVKNPREVFSHKI